ncbi:hypothetical protein PFBG_02054 [Plasmodium falciparum 7G8]|uniref:Erythrocyte membrane protein 1, PfEMP1 n=2 Tax=Plasmodium falciparum TaxID=5833 RepID=W7F920_PLAF8|nr:hypothetical protein PFBG_02054 [Plasmodium falciparum 7G8]
MGPAPKSTPDYSKATNVKELFELIGETVQQKAHDEAVQRGNTLHAVLSKAEFPTREGIDTPTSELCNLNYEFDTNVTNGRSNPCYGRQGVRFSDKEGAECYRTRIKYNDHNTGSCAPFRRLHMCDRNLEEIYPDKIKKTDNLLVDVLLAAKHEGEMITKKLKEYDEKHYNSRICTELARSFADIGDIVRGKDLFLGHNQRKKKLEERLEQMFKNIQENNEKLKGLSIDAVREYWWALNRQDVWKAITCKAERDDKYFREKNSNGNTCTVNKCKCANGDPPTNLDYVPQFLRWFEEWAEDFCRKKKKYVNIVKKFCRNDEQKLYCSLNGHDCTQTIRKIGLLRMGNGCTKCLHACSHYRGWLANQEKEFKKQKTKYEKEINGSSSQKKGTPDNVNNEYDRKFYNKLQDNYRSVETFLHLLNEEKECKAITTVEGKINFPKDNYKETFYRSDYCELCPECGVDCEPGKCTQRKEGDDKCKKQVPERKGDPKITDIEFLFNDKEGDDIVKKLIDFFYTQSSDKKKKGIEEWQCSHYNDNDNECVTKNNGKDVKADTKTMPFVDFFQFWVTHLLNDAIEWRKEINKCLNNNPLTKCNNRCNRYCKFFTKWVEQKQKEWGKIKEHFDKQDELIANQHFTILETLLENEFFDQIKEAYGDVKSIEKIKELLNNNRNKKDNEIQNKEDIIQKLLEHDLDDANKCRETHNDKNCQDTSGGRSITNEDDDSEDEEHEKPPERDNPCAEPNGSNTKHPAIVNQVTHAIQEDTHAEASKRSLSLLKADALEGKYLGSGKEHKLKNICGITKDHSNCTNRSKEPCGGKDTEQKMFDIKEGWKNGEFVNKTHTHTYMPPRRQHFCTSNLEYLETKDSPFCSNNSSVKVINDSFLGDVLLSAKSEAKFIIGKYRNAPDGFKDEETICRALRYSFADLGDIIKGTDLWDENQGEKKIQETLKQIFDNIYKKNLDIKEKYKKIDDQKHLHLREDWWEANRKDVWKAMQCELKDLKKSHGDCHYNSRGTPLDDYIPQRLRWMTEWAEWYCKMQKKEYEKLKEQCKECKDKDNGQGCTKESGEICTKCDKQCKEYGKNIKKWEKQWKQIELKYQILYWQAQTDARNVGRSVYFGFEKDQHFLKFFKEIRKENYGKKTYETAEGYVHQEVPHMECQVQKEFCKKKHGDNNNYAFRHQPYEYDEMLNCVNKEKKKQEKKEKPKEEEDPECKTVNDILKQNDGNEQVGDCHPKNKGNNYPDWTCEKNKFENNQEGPCMPPRRQKLCLYYLTLLVDKDKEEKLREAFIKTAAAETFLSWHYFKNKNGNGNILDEELKKGKIPEEFLRSMFFTYADYRDICLDTDISKKEKDVGTAKTKIDNIFKNGKLDGLSRDEWWEKHGREIWKGMLCALTKYVTDTDNKRKIKNDYSYDKVNQSQNGNPSLEDFAKKPQFLRWMIEWGEEFCREREKLEQNIGKHCGEHSGNGCKEGTPCKTACEKYEDYVKKKKGQFKGQTDKFVTDANLENADPEYKGYAYIEGKGPSKQGNHYLLKNCDNKKCDCMDGDVRSEDSSEKPFGIYSHEYKNKCDCLGGRHAPSDPKAHPPPPRAQQPQETPQQPPPAQDDVKVCQIVANILTGNGNLKEACKLKYNGKYYGWKCVTPSGDTTSGKDGAICIPPRRRRLYVGKLEQWAATVNGNKEGSESGESGSQVTVQGQGADGKQTQEHTAASNSTLTTSPPSSHPRADADAALRDAFIQSAAIETFFLWDRYKKEWLAQKKAELQREGGLPGVGVAPGVGLGGVGVAGGPQLPNGDTISGDQTPENQLQSGTIPPDFLRQMFYTLADYKDILYSGSKDAKNGYSDIFSGDNVIKEREEKIKGAIQTFFQNGDSQPPSGKHVTQNSVKTPSTSDKDPKAWWNKHGPDIWHGMVCALTYEDSEQKGGGGKPTQIQNAQNLLNKIKKETGEKEGEYHYGKVELKEEVNGAKSTESTSAASSDTPTPKTTLKNFVVRPTYFRYLEEWGQNFCKERKKRLEKIEEECKVENGGKKQNPKCSGDGEDCKDIREQDYDTISNFKCPKCGIHCSSYKKWIQRKGKEFEDQQKIYNEQKTKCQTQSNGAAPNNGGNTFCGTVTMSTTAAEFLEKLGPCSKNVSGKDNEKIFEDKDKTFRPADNCKPCSQFRVNCKNGNCGGSPNGNTCNGKNSIDANDIEKMGNSTVIDMLVSDDSTNGVEGVLDECIEAHIFKGIRKDVWECGEYCGVDICKPENVNGGTDGKEYIQIRALLKRWVENFLEDYNKIKHKISHCTKKGEKTICIKHCDKKCECVGKWVENKKKEWPKIRERYFKQYTIDYSDIYKVTSFLEDSQFYTEVQKAIKPCPTLNAFEKSKQCNAAANTENDKKKDVVECLLNKLDRLKKKIEECQSKHSGSPEERCQDPPPEDDYEEENNEENPVTQPNICPAPADDKKKEEEGDDCNPASPGEEKKDEKKDEKKEESEVPAKEDGVPAAGPEDDTEEKAPVPRTPALPNPPPQLLDDPLLKPALMSSTIMWSIGIGFAAFTYFYLKKKTKSSVGNLFQILQIPKSDYDIPTLKSKNRYIPYRSGTYKGKTYIYMEGDSSGDEKYAFMSDTTDVTSSESEYEELDINDIYVPGSPKYKTLIEVVLEPSKRDTQNDIHNDIPSDIPNTPSDTPPPITDDEWNQLKKDFISNMLQNTQNTEPNILHDNVDNNTHPTMSRHKVDQKPFIMSIHDRNLYIGEEYSYDMSTNSGQNNVYSGIDPTSANHDSYSDKNDPISDNHHPYSGIDLINDVLNGDYDIYDEILKRKENELFGTYHTKKNTSTNSVAKNTNSDPILNQINLFHKWLDRHRYMCAKLKNKEDILNKLKEEWNKENNNNSGKTYNSDNKPSHNHVLNTDVSIQIDMDNPKTKNEFKNMDTTPDKSTMNTMLDDLEKYNEPYYYDFYKDDIYYDVNDDDKASVDHNKMDNNNSDVPTKVQIEMNVINNQELLQNEYPISHM